MLVFYKFLHQFLRGEVRVLVGECVWSRGRGIRDMLRCGICQDNSRLGGVRQMLSSLRGSGERGRIFGRGRC